MLPGGYEVYDNKQVNFDKVEGITQGSNENLAPS
jgi:hypothetical protein